MKAATYLQVKSCLGRPFGLSFDLDKTKWTHHNHLWCTYAAPIPWALVPLSPCPAPSEAIFIDYKIKTTNTRREGWRQLMCKKGLIEMVCERQEWWHSEIDFRMRVMEMFEREKKTVMFKKLKGVELNNFIICYT